MRITFPVGKLKTIFWHLRYITRNENVFSKCLFIYLFIYLFKKFIVKLVSIQHSVLIPTGGGVLTF